MQQGLYENLITKLIASKISSLDKQQFYVKETIVEKSDVARVLSHHVSRLLRMAKQKFRVDVNALPDHEKLMLTMLHYDFWQSPGGAEELSVSISKIGRNEHLVSEMVELLELVIDRIAHIETDAHLPFVQPLKVHSRYSREQILAAFGENTFERKSSNREGVVNLEAKNAELLLITKVVFSRKYSYLSEKIQKCLKDFEFVRMEILL